MPCHANLPYPGCVPAQRCRTRESENIYDGTNYISLPFALPDLPTLPASFRDKFISFFLVLYSSPLFSAATLSRLLLLRGAQHRVLPARTGKDDLAIPNGRVVDQRGD